MNPHQLASNSHRRSEVYPFFQLIMLSHCSPKAQVSEASLTQGTKSRQVPDPLTCSPAFNSEPHMCWLGTFADPDTTQPSSPYWIWICFGSSVLNLHPEPKSLRFPGRARAQETLREQRIPSLQDRRMKASQLQVSLALQVILSTQGWPSRSPELPEYKPFSPGELLSTVLPKTRLWVDSRAKRS